MANTGRYLTVRVWVYDDDADKAKALVAHRLEAIPGTTNPYRDRVPDVTVEVTDNEPWDFDG